MQHRSRFSRRLCVAVDLEGYGGRDDVEQYDVQAELPEVLDEAAGAAGLDRSAWDTQEQGDGELALVPPDQPEPRIIDDFTRELAAVLRLRNHNRTPRGRLRLRAAICFGVAYQARFGFAGEGVVATARLLASECLHRALAEDNSSDIAVALSPEVFQTVVARHTSLTTDQFVRVQIREKEYIGDAWLRTLPGTRITKVGSEDRSQSQAAEGFDRSRRPVHQEPVSPHMQNEFHGPVEAGVIGWNLGSVKEGRP